jgi:hypothetical protein
LPSYYCNKVKNSVSFIAPFDQLHGAHAQAKLS